MMQVLDLAFLGPEVEEARADIEDIFFLRLFKEVIYIFHHVFNISIVVMNIGQNTEFLISSFID